MTGRILYYLIVFALIAGCSKDETENDENTEFDYFIRYKENGQPKEYKFEITANMIPETAVTGALNEKVNDTVSFQYEGDVFTSLINARAGLDPKTAEVFMFAVFTEDLIGTNVSYSEDNTLGIIAYFNDGTNLYSSESEGSNDVEITWTSISDIEARGTFSGTLFQENSNSSLEITDGKFFVLTTNQSFVLDY